MSRWLGIGLVGGLCAVSAQGEMSARTPYVGAIVLDARTGAVLFEDHADRPGQPADLLKLMDLFIVLDRLEAGGLRLEDEVKVTKAAANIGGSQVYLDEREVFRVESLLYAVAVHSANDAAMALATHVADGPAEFVQWMNEKAHALGLSSATRFATLHGQALGGLSPPDLSTARDLAHLCRALLEAHPDVLRYTSTREHRFREKPRFDIRNGNRLLGTVPGCDGLMVGFHRDAGHSIAATAQRDGVRLLVVVLGSRDRQVRDALVVEWFERYFPQLQQAPSSLP